MAGAVIGALVGMALGGAGVTIAGFTAGTMWMAGASIGSLFDRADMGLDYTSPTYSLGKISNTKSQLVPIPIVYGQCRVGGNVFLQDFLDDKKERMNMFVAVSEGPIEEISSVLANDQDPSSLDSCSVTAYLGTPDQARDSRHPEISGELEAQGYTGTYANLAYIALTLKAQERLSGTPTITSIVKGRRIWTPSGILYSRNPVWCLIDLLSHTRYGLGMCTDGHPNWGLIDYDCALESAAYCDEEVDGGPRFRLDYVIDTQKACVDVMTDILSTFRGYVIGREKIQICIDRPRPIYKYIDLSKIIEGSFSWKQQDPDDMYNRVTVNWTNPDDHYESNAYIIEDEDRIASEGIVEKTYDLAGITRLSQAARMGAYLIDTANGVRDICSFGLSLEDADIEVGDVIGVTHDLPGWGDYDGKHPDNPSKAMRVVKLEDMEDDDGLEYVAATCAEYVEEIYNDRAGDIPTHIDTGLENPWDPDEVTDLAITEQLILGSDGTYHQTAGISWTLPSELLNGIEIWWKYSLESAWKQAATLSPYSTAYTFLDLEIGEILQVKVITISRFGVRSKGAVATSKLNGDGEPPAVPAGVTAAGGYRTITLKWNQVTSLDFSHVEVWESMDDDISNAYKIAETSATYFVVSNLGTMDTRWYWLKAVDYAGNESGFSNAVSATTLAIPQEDLPELEISETQTDELLTQSYEQLERDAEGTIQGLLRSYRDRQNSITEVARVNDQVGAMYTLRLESDGSIVGVAMQAGKDAADIVFRADRVFFKTSSGEAIPMFTLQDGQAYFNGDVFADGSIVGNKIYSKSTISLADGGRLLIGNSGLIQIGDTGPILLDISGDYPRIRVGDPGDPDTGPYLEIAQGDIRAYKYYDGAYELQKNLRKMVSGIADNNTVVTLAGHWESEPEIICSIEELTAYNPSYSGQKQTWRVQAANITYDITTKKCAFKPVVQLLVAGSTSTVVCNEEEHLPFISGDESGAEDIPYTMTTGNHTIPPNVDSITVGCKYFAQRVSGGSGNTGDWDVDFSNLKVTITATVSGIGNLDIGTFNLPQSSYDDVDTNSHYFEVSKTFSIDKSTSSRTIYLSFKVESRGGFYTVHKTTWNNAIRTGGWGYFADVVCNLPSATVIDTGKVNYLAVGE